MMDEISYRNDPAVYESCDQKKSEDIYSVSSPGG